MRAVTIVDGKVEVREHPDPQPGAGEVLVRVAAAGLNGADMAQVAGHYPAPPGEPQDIPGLELAGTVVEVGPRTSRFEVGDRVMTIVGGGGQAELAVVNERVAMPVPDRLDLVAAGGFPEVVATAHDALFTQAGLTMGARVLVSGAAGGVGTAAVQLAVAAGARVVASVRDPSHRDAVAAYGAEVIAPEATAEAGPVDVILELVGAPNFPANVKALAPWGRIMVIGVGAGGAIELDLRVLLMKRGRLLASSIRTRTLEEKAGVARRLEAQVLPLVEAGRLTVPVAATYPLERAAEAYQRFAAGRKLGKIILLMDEGRGPAA
jgi:NADPH2:quinone reductase